MKNSLLLFQFGLYAVVGVFTLDIYLPAVPEMSKQLGVSTYYISLTFTAFSFAFAVSQLIYGPLSDVVGRKPVLILGLTVAFMATLVCTMFNDYFCILIARVIQAFGISVFVVINPIIRDIFAAKKAVMVRIFINTVSGITISIAPAVGSLLVNHWGWKSSFFASYSIILVALFYPLFLFQETKPAEKRAILSVPFLIKNYREVFSNKYYLLNVFVVSLAYSVHFAFIIQSTHIFIDTLSYNLFMFGILMFLYGLSYFLSGLLTGYLSKKLTQDNLFDFGLLSLCLTSIIILILPELLFSKTVVVLSAVSIMTFGININRSVSMTRAFERINTQSGTGASGLNFVQFVCSSIIATCLSCLPFSPIMTLGYLCFASALFIIILQQFINYESQILQYHL